jgi:hypothetical protein
VVGHAAGRASRAAAQGGRCDGARRAEFVERGIAEAGGAPMWYQFNVTLAANMLREAPP